MSVIRIEIDEPLAALLHQTNQPVQAAAREMIVLELYRRGAISSGKAAELLGTSRLAFIQHASGLGVVADASPLIAFQQIGQIQRGAEPCRRDSG